MRNIVKSAFAHISSVFKQFQVKRFFAVVLVGFLLLNTGVGFADGSKDVTNKIDRLVNQGDSDRPKTVGQWNKEARQTEDAPLQRLKRIGKESAEAVEDFGEMYADTADDSTPDLNNKMNK